LPILPYYFFHWINKFLIPHLDLQQLQKPSLYQQRGQQSLQLNALLIEKAAALKEQYVRSSNNLFICSLLDIRFLTLLLPMW
jgi:hypothetical protein